MPVETTERQELQCSKKFFASVVFAFLCITGSVAIAIFVIFTKVLNTDNTDVVGILSFIAIILFITGGLTIIMSRDQRSNHSTCQVPEVVISPIPEEDLEKSPAPDLNSIASQPRRYPFVADLQCTGLPDCFATVQSIDEVYSFDDVRDEMSPPTYEQALRSTTEQSFVTLASSEAGEIDTKCYSQGTTEDTRL